MKREVELESLSFQDDDADPLLKGHFERTESTEIEEVNDAAAGVADHDDSEAGMLPCCRICLESDAELGYTLIFLLSFIISLLLKKRNSCSL